MKIAVVFTGGTIGSKINGGVIDADEKANYTLLSYLEKDIEVEAFSPFNTLSEYFTGEHINSLAECVENILKMDFDGVIITHGTDTLQYSSCALGYIFADSKLPIIFVSSQYVLDNPLNNGKQNFLDAVEFIKGNCGNGVFVTYQNNDKRRYVHRGVRLLESDVYTDDVKSVCNSIYGEFTENGFVLKDKNLSFESFPKVTLNKYCESILSIRAAVGLNYREIPENTQAVIHSTYHSGTLNTQNEALFLEAIDKNIPVFVTGSGDVSYESAVKFNALNIKSLPKMSPLCAYVKMWLIIDGRLPFDLIYRDFGDIIC